jgi:hypothetical protein
MANTIKLFSFLTVNDEPELIKLISKAILIGIKHTIFREPDIGNQITAVAFEPSDLSRKLTSSCSLLGKELSNAYISIQKLILFYTLIKCIYKMLTSQCG